MRYLAYGSNLWTPRLRQRVPSARPLGPVELVGREVRFRKRSVDGSGKCDLASARRPGVVAYGVVWEIDARERPSLDAVEGVGSGYRILDLELRVDGEILTAFTYLAQPSHVDESLVPYDWYLAFVVAGAREHGLPRDYVQRLRRTRSRPDPSSDRAAPNRRLLAGALRRS